MVFISRFIEQSHWERRLITILLLLLPWQTRWVWLPFGSSEYWDPYRTYSWYVSAVPVLVLLGFFLRRILLDWGVRDVSRVKLPLVHCVGIAGIASAALFVAWSQDVTTSLFFVSQWVLMTISALLLIWYAHTRVITGEFFVSRLTVSLSVVAGFAVAQFFTQIVPGSTLLGIASQNPLMGGASVLEIAGVRVLRAYGSFGHPNILGGYMVAGVLMLMHAWLLRMRLPSVWGVGWVLMMSALFVSFSRSAWIALVLGMAMLSYYYGRRTFIWWVGASTVMILLGVFFAPLVMLRIGGHERLEARAVSERIEGVREAVQLLPHIPYTGIGPGAYISVIARRDPYRAAWSYQPPHNVPLLVLVETGYIGLLLLVMGWVLLVYRNPVVASALLPIGLFDHYLWTLWSGMVLIMIWMVWVYIAPYQRRA